MVMIMKKKLDESEIQIYLFDETPAIDYSQV